ncbi:MAG: TetR/AcrR family transcriptional regulator [bacterium]|nr:TetR/AcrR family transcriptional regulator [bacterium]
MNHKSEDSAKVLQTRRMLAAQLIRLLENKNFKKITVNDICQSAMISRSAFYLHFEDKYHLLHYCLEEELERWKHAMRNKSVDEFILYILDCVLDKKNFYYNTIATETDREVTSMFQKVFQQFFWNYLKERQEAGCTFPGPLSITSAFYAGGLATSTAQWIQNDFIIPKEEIAACQKALISPLIDSMH